MRVEITGLSKTFGDIIAVDDLDLVAEEGELTTLLGPSGCGKTTTLRCVSGLERPTGGRITIGDQVVDHVSDGISVPAQQRNVGFIFQSFDVWPHMTVRENVAYPLHVRDVPKREIDERVADILDLADIGHLSEQDATNLSGGQQARVGMCRALVYEPKLLLCDEPLTGLDRSLRKTMRQEIRRIQSDLGITTLYVTHSQPEAMSISDKICLMNTQGRSEQIGRPEELYQEPVSKYAFDFVGASQTLQGTLADGQGVDTPIGHVVCDVDGVGSQRVTVGFRPEAVDLQLEAAADWDENTWTGQIRHAFYLGDVYEFTVEVGGQLIQSRVTIEDYRDRGLAAAVGERAHIHIAPDDIFTFAAG
jgi:iron(III) transport system ATP-binding protein